MLVGLLQSSYFALFLIVALGFVLGRINFKGISLDVSAVIFIALLFGHFFGFFQSPQQPRAVYRRPEKRVI